MIRVAGCDGGGDGGREEAERESARQRMNTPRLAINKQNQGNGNEGDRRLNRLEDLRLLELSLVNLRASLLKPKHKTLMPGTEERKRGDITDVCNLAMEFQKLADVELGRLEDLGLADVHILDGVNPLGRLLDLLSNRLGDELGDKLLQVDAGRLTSHDLEHLLTDFADLSGLSVGGLLDLVWPALGEGNGEEANEITVGRLDVNVSLDQRLPFPDERT